MTSSQFRISALLFAAIVALVPACDDSKSATPSKAKSTSNGTDDTAKSADCSDLPKSQGPSDPCCPDYGVDACGANLFCAAFEGRKTPTCYVEGQQLGGEECTDDVQCASKSCNTKVGKCAGVTVGDSCDPEAGCAGALTVCTGKKCTAATGKAQSPCDDDSDCPATRPLLSNNPVAGICTRGRCGFPNGTYSVGRPSECASRFANDTVEGEGVSYVCAACASDSDCLSVESRKFEVCQKGVCVHTCLNDSQCGSFVCRNEGCAGDAAYTCVDKFCR